MGYNDADGYRGIEPATYNVFRCNGCTRISLYIWSAFHGPDTEFGKREYPVWGIEYGLPSAVQLAYLDAERVKQHSDGGYAIMARRVLEAVARDRGIVARSLAQALVELVEREHIPPVLAEALTLIRVFGNAAAHGPHRAVTALHTEMIERFLGSFIDHIYVAPDSLRQFRFMLGIDIAEPGDI